MKKHLCPECNKPMSKIDNTTFLSKSIMTQLFHFKLNHYACLECNIIEGKV